MLRSAQSELAKLREDRGKTDETARALSETIKNLKSDNRQLHQQLERARREME
jgi:septal ring factor EnvC (AmiA/AmiB activator)